MSEDLTKNPQASDSEKLTLIVTGVEALASRVDSQLCPILHKMGADISQLQEGQKALRADVSQLQEGQKALRADISQLQEGQKALRADVSQLQEGQKALRADVSQLQEGQKALSTELRADILQLQEGQRALSTEFRSLRRDVDHRFNLIYDKLVETERYDHDIHDRVSRLELSTNPPNTQT